MPLDILKDCNKYVIQKIYNPGSYLITESGNEKYYEKEIRRLKYLLSNSTGKPAVAKQIRLDKLVAIKSEKGFQVGRVNDIFSRNGETKYLISLLESGETIETRKKKIYAVRNQELKDEMKNAFEISLYGVQPAVLDINDKNPSSSGIFHLRKCNNWSPGAFEFVRSLFISNQNVFVKIITKEKNISGEIYFVIDSNWKPVSLGQKLCDEGFAVFCDTTVNSSNNYSHTYDYRRGILEKIPTKAFIQ